MATFLAAGIGDGKVFRRWDRRWQGFLPLGPAMG